MPCLGESRLRIDLVSRAFTDACSNPRHGPLPDDHCALIRRRAAEAAVAPPALGGIFPSSARPGKLIAVRFETQNGLPPWAVGSTKTGPPVVLKASPAPLKRVRTKRRRMYA